MLRFIFLGAFSLEGRRLVEGVLVNKPLTCSDSPEVEVKKDTNEVSIATGYPCIPTI